MDRLKEENKKGPSTIEAYRAHDPSEFYLTTQKKKDRAIIRAANDKLLSKVHLDIVV